MKSIALAAAISLAASSAFAGSVAGPVMDAPVINDTATSSSGGGVIVPLIAVLLVWAAMQ